MFKSQLPQYAQNRKDAHVTHALAQHQTIKQSPFETIRFIHHSFSPHIIDEISLEVTWGNTTHTSPFFINGMTGGSDATLPINQKLAYIAKEVDLAMASGSVSAALHDPTVAKSYQVIRQENPNGFVMANLGAHHSVDNAKKAVDLLEANALQIHLNIPQEIVMPEGDRDFRNWSKNIESIVTSLEVPVIVKEVGFGMSQETIRHLINLGVSTIDISGRGGTNFVEIENERRDTLDFAALRSWGQTTPEALLEAYPLRQNVTLLASGGVLDYFDIVKALALGATAVGLSGRLLHFIHTESVESVIDKLNQWKEAIRQLCLLLNVTSPSELQTTDLILPPDLIHWANQRQLDWQIFAKRSQ